MLLILKELILLKPIRSQERLSEAGDYHLEDIVYELNYESAKLPVK
jgi:hypothetical protein